ncbi:MAG: O-antigen ligase family protein [Pseudomonadota bacterium]
MRRTILLSLFLVLLADQMFGWGLGLAPGLSVKNAYLYAIFAIILLEGVINKQEIRFDAMAIHAPFLLLIVLAIISVLYVGIVVELTGYRLLRGLVTVKNNLVDHYLFFIVFCYGLRSTRDVLWLGKAMLVIIALANFITLVDLYNIPNLGLIGDFNGRVEGPLGQPNEYGGLLAFFVPLLIGAVFNLSGFGRLVFVGSALVGLGMLILSGSRGAYVGLVFGALLSVIALRGVVRSAIVVKWALAFSIILSLTILVIYIQYPEVMQERFEKSTDSNLDTVSSNRTWIWASALGVMMQDPISFLTGFGWNSFNLFRIQTDPHNTYLYYLFSLGIAGLVGFFFLVRNIVKFVADTARITHGPLRTEMTSFVFGFMAVLVAIFFTVLYKPWPFVWAYVGLAVRLCLNERIEHMASQQRARFESEGLIRQPV